MILALKGLDDFMLPCINKQVLGLECMGCGIQRSIAFLLKGEFLAAFYMYPAIYTIIGLFGFLLVNTFRDFKYANKIIIILAIANVLIIVGNFLIKLYLN